MPRMSADANLVTYAEAAEILGYKSVRSVHRLREDGDLVPIVRRTPRNGSIVRFKRSEVEAIARRTARRSA